MDDVVLGALEEIRSQGTTTGGLTLPNLWPKIQTHGLHLCTNVKQALWSRLLAIPTLRFESNGVSYDAHDPSIHSVEVSEAMELKIVASQGTTLDTKLRTDGVTQNEDLDTEHVILVKRGQITEELMELPIEQQIYDMIDAEGSNGFMLSEVYKRLGIKNKRYYPRILDTKSRFGMHLDSERLNKGVAYRVRTSGNYNTGIFNTKDDKLSSRFTNLQSEANGIIPDVELQISNVKSASNSVSSDLSSSASPAPRRCRSYTTYPCLGRNSVNSLREQRILAKLQEEKILIRPELHRLLESLEKKHGGQMDKKTLERSLNKLQEDGHCKCISFAVPSVTNCDRTQAINVVLHPSVYKAEDLSDQVHDKWRSFQKQKHKLKLAASTKDQKFQLSTHASVSRKRKRSSKEKPVNNEGSLHEKSGKLKQAKMSRAEDATQEHMLINETHMLINEMGGQKEVVEDEGALSKLQSSCPNRFLWTESKDRLLVIEYVKYHAAHGANFNRTDWTSLQSLPGPPTTCKRRMSRLKRNKQFRKAVTKLCDMLSVRYAKHVENSKNKSLGDGCRMIIRDQNAPDLVNRTKDFCIDEPWDDFDNKDIKMLLDEVFTYKKIAKLETTKATQHISQYSQSDVGGERHKSDENTLGSSATPTNEIKKDRGRREASSRKSRRRLPKSYVMLMNQAQNSGTQAYKSVAVSNAIELFKLVFLSSAKGPEAPNMLAETLRRYSEQDLFTAFNYLRDKNFMAMDKGINNFVLSPQFLHNMSLSEFLPNTGKRAAKMARWLQEKDNELLENGVKLFADLQCGDVLQLCVLMCSGELSMFPCLPDEGIGDVEEYSKKRKCDANDRKEKGFPGIKLFLSCQIIPRVDAIALSRYENANTSGSNLEYKSLPSELIDGISKSNADSELTWKAMSCYARHLASSARELFPFSPNLFETVHSAIQKAGDQGLSMEGISEIIDVPGEGVPELLVEVLEAFGSALKVNAYDSVRVVESLYRSKYFLASVASHQHDVDLKVPVESCIQGYKSTEEATFKPILPWVNGDGTVNEIVYKGLVRCVLGIVMQNPGILEETVVISMNVLNPQSCRTLLELMILDNHIIVRKMYRSISNKPPALLSSLLGCSYKKPKLVCREHLFANLRSIHYL